MGNFLSKLLQKFISQLSISYQFYRRLPLNNFYSKKLKTFQRTLLEFSINV